MEDSAFSGFLVLGGRIGTCSIASMHWPGIAVLPGAVHPLGEHVAVSKIELKLLLEMSIPSQSRDGNHGP